MALWTSGDPIINQPQPPHHHKVHPRSLMKQDVKYLRAFRAEKTKMRLHAAGTKAWPSTHPWNPKAQTICGSGNLSHGKLNLYDNISHLASHWAKNAFSNHCDFPFLLHKIHQRSKQTISISQLHLSLTACVKVACFQHRCCEISHSITSKSFHLCRHAAERSAAPTEMLNCASNDCHSKGQCEESETGAGADRCPVLCSPTAP